MNRNSALAALSPVARAYHDEYWKWLWNGPAEERTRTIGEKKNELRNKYGPRAEEELLAALRADGYLQNTQSDTEGRSPGVVCSGLVGLPLTKNPNYSLAICIDRRLTPTSVMSSRDNSPQ